VVDIGAGTTDIGVFQALTPLKESRSKNKLIPCGPTRSVFKAGNEIDEVVLEMLTSHSHISGNERYDLEARIRQIKESLFDNGFVREYGVRLEVDELVQHPRMKAMVIEIRKCLEDVIASNVSTLSIWTGLKSNFQEHVDLIMAGGGGGIDFIIKALCKPLLINKTLMGVARCETLFDRSIIIYGAGIGRMAVALGGSNINYDNLQHEYTKIISIPSLGFPKQVISSAKSSASTADTLSEKVHHSLKAVAEGELRKQQAREAAERIRRQRWQEQYQIHAVATAREGPEAGYLFVEFLLADDAIRFMDECLSILHRGALGRHTKSQIKLATLLENRREASSDLEDAFYWFCCAGYSGHAIYLKDAERLASNLNTDRCDYLRLQAMRLSASTNIKATSQRGFSENDRKLERVSLETRAFDDNKGPISQNNIPNQNSRAESTFPEGGDSSLEKLRVLSLVLRARSLRKPTLPIESEKELLRWSTVKNPIEAYFMATYLGITAPKPNFNDKTLQITLERWIRISRLVD
jgi:hypothetical protein